MESSLPRSSTVFSLTKLLWDGKRFKTPVGTPQGSVISPLLANVYLHYVFDLWIAWWRKQRQGDVVIIRYADDCAPGHVHLR
jgi:RNA-directed DNA polymerase